MACVTAGMDRLPVAAQIELAHFFRGQAAECRALATAIKNVGASAELSGLAAALHAHALDLERPAR